MKFIKTTIIITFTIIFSLLISLSSSSSVVDFCVADFNFPVTPTGYPCKNSANVTVDDFVFTGMTIPSFKSSSNFNVSASYAIDKTIPGLNGQGLSLVQFNFGVGGAAPMHSHIGPEIVYVMEGSFVAGFIASDNSAYYKTLNKGDVMIFPPSLLHFQVNVGNVTAVLLCSFNTAFNPNFQSTTPSLGGNDLPTEIVHKTTLLDPQQVKKLKDIFGGTN